MSSQEIHRMLGRVAVESVSAASEGLVRNSGINWEIAARSPGSSGKQRVKRVAGADRVWFRMLQRSVKTCFGRSRVWKDLEIDESRGLRLQRHIQLRGSTIFLRAAIMMTPFRLFA